MSSPPRKLAEELEPIVGYTKVDKAVIATAKEYDCSTTYERYVSGKHSQNIIYAEMLADFSLPNISSTGRHHQWVGPFRMIA